MLHRAAQARAFIEGRDFCLPDDFKQLIVPVFRASRGGEHALRHRAEKIRAGRSILSEIIDATRRAAVTTRFGRGKMMSWRPDKLTSR